MRAAPDPAPRPDPAGDGVPAAGRRGSAGGSRPRRRPHRPPLGRTDRTGPAPGPGRSGTTRSRLPSDRPCAAACSPSSTGPPGASDSGRACPAPRPVGARPRDPPPAPPPAAPPRGRRASSGRRRRRRRARARRRVRARATLFFSVPTPDDAVNNQVALISYADGTQLTRLVPEQGNRMVVPDRAGPPARARGRARRRGPLVLLQPGLRPDRDPAGGVEPAARRRRRRLDDHPAVRQEHPRRRRGDAVAQVPGDGRRGQDLPGSAARTRSSATTSTPSTSAAAPTASRRRRRPTSAGR